MSTPADIVVDPDIKSLFPPLTDGERANLRDLLRLEGFREELVVWSQGNVLLDGHARHELATELGIEPRVRVIDLPDREAAIQFVIARQLGRRTLGRLATAYFIGKLYESVKRQGRRTDLLTSRQSDEKWADERVAEQYGVSPRTVFKRDDGGLRNTFLKYVPGEEPDEPFDTFRETVIDGLREAECIPTAGGGWAKPGEVLFDSFGLRDLLTDADVRQLLGRPYVAEGFQAPRPLLRSLGVAFFGVAELARCLGHTEWLRGRSDDWLRRLYARLSALDLRDGLEQLKAVALVPLEDGTFASPKARRVFLPLATAATYGFERKVPMVRKALLDGADDGVAKGAEKFLRSVGVRKADPADLIADYILPLFESEDEASNWQAASEDVLVGAVGYIKDHLAVYLDAGHGLDRLRDELLLRSTHQEGNFYCTPTDIYLSAPYGGGNDLEGLFEGVGEIYFLHESYLTHGLGRQARRRKKAVDSPDVQKKRGAEADAWREFFARIGVKAIPRVVRQLTTYEPEQAHSPDLERLFATAKPDKIRRAAAMLDANWGEYRQFLSTRIMTTQRRYLVEAGRRRTRFGELLAGRNWLPAESGRLCRPDGVFVGTPETREVLGGDVEYLGTDLKDPRLAEDLGVHRRPTAATALARLRRLVREGSADVTAYRRIYQFFDSLPDTNATEFVPAFRAERLLFIPAGQPRFLTAGSAFWDEVGRVFGATRVGLARHWPDLRHFFVERLRVPVAPAARDYALRLRELAAAGPLSRDGEAVAWDIYRELDHRIAADPDLVSDEPWWDEVTSAEVFWTTAGEFRASDGSLFVNDRDELHELFADRAEVGFLKLPPSQHPRIRHFLAAAGIPLLTAAVRVDQPAVRELRPEPALTARCRGVVPYIARYMFFKEQGKYRELAESGRLDDLRRVQVFVSDDLCVTAALGSTSVTLRRPVASRFPDLYVRGDAAGDLDGLAAELIAMIAGSDALVAFTAAAITRGEAGLTERFMQAVNIPELPAEEHAPTASPPDQQLLPPVDETSQAPLAAADEAEDHSASASPDAVLSATIHEADGDEGDSEEDFTVGPAAAAPTVVAVSTVVRPPATTNPPSAPARPTSSTGRPPGGYGADAAGAGVPPPTTAEVVPSPTPSSTSEPWVPAVEAALAPIRVTEVTPPAGAARPPRTGSVQHPTGAEPHSAPAGETEPPVVASTSNAVPIGVWGERYALRWLRDEVASRHAGAAVEQTAAGFRFTSGGRLVAEIRWLNHNGDVGVGCDIVVEDGATEYVEVKTTADEARTAFDITSAQWDAAREHGPSYRILRVFNAGSPRVRAEAYRDPYRLWREGSLTARPVRLVL